MSNCVNRFLALTITLTSLANAVVAQRAIPEDNLAYPVLIKLGNGNFGSGFYLSTKDSTYLVTAKHVLFDPATNRLLDSRVALLSYSGDSTDLNPNRATLDMNILQANANIKPHATEDVVVVRIFSLSSVGGRRMASPLPGVVVQSSSKTGIVGADSDTTVLAFDQVIPGHEVIVFGYPDSLALEQLRQLDPNRPLLRKGIVAGTIPERHSIILDCPVYFGNSGGPVLELDHVGFQTKLRIIGVVNQYVPFVQAGGSQTFAMQIMSNSGYSIATPMDFVLELLK